MHILAALSSATAFLALAAVLVAATPANPAPPGTPYPATTGPAGVPRIHLWSTTPNVVAGADSDGNPTEPTLDLYLPPADKAPPGGFGAVVILPGGGYTNLATDHEGRQEGHFFQDHNITGFVVRYRHAPRYRYPIPLIDAQRAIRLVRANAAAFHLNPDKIGIMGFSAGGHLAAMTTTLFDNGPKLEAPYTPDSIDAASAKPNFAILMYPVIDLTDDKITHQGSRSALLQNNKDLYESLSPQKHVTKDNPPVFLVHGTNDAAVPVMNSILFYEACLKAGVPAEMHILENAPHGFGMAQGTNAAFDDEMRSWPEQALRWLGRRGLK